MENKKGLYERSLPLNYILCQLAYFAEARQNKWFKAGFISENLLNYYSGKYHLKFPIFEIKFADPNGKLSEHITFLTEDGYQSSFTRNDGKIRYARTVTNGPNRLETYKDINSLKGYFGRRVGYEETIKLLDKVKDSRTVIREEQEIIQFSSIFVRLIKVLNYLPEDQLSIVQYYNRMQLRCFPITNNYSTSNNDYKLTIIINKDSIAIQFLDSEEMKRTEEVKFEDVPSINKIFKLITKTLNLYGTETPFDMDYFEEEEF